ncbi:unnamed protein product [Vicia faba]|uniref:Uncharacterized protein n=1 Tax=Vicia faba TaxID=3906 RepID=A0AAV1BBQ1_VICFA|nr:unnamed protein product [Vicia faba]
MPTMPIHMLRKLESELVRKKLARVGAHIFPAPLKLDPSCKESFTVIPANSLTPKYFPKAGHACSRCTRTFLGILAEGRTSSMSLAWHHNDMSIKTISRLRQFVIKSCIIGLHVLLGHEFVSIQTGTKSIFNFPNLKGT